MLKVEYTEVMNFEGALRGARNPLKSWDKSDSIFGCSKNFNKDCLNTNEYLLCENCSRCFIGDNDHNLMKRLVKAGSSHRKFIRQIFVSVDITAPLYWWKQFDQYKIGVVTNSESTMHCIHKKEFELDDFSCERLVDESMFSNITDASGEYGELCTPMQHLECTIEVLNACREAYCETKDKKYWDSMIQLLPTSYNQKRTVTFNYENLRNMYHERKNHKLDEWHQFCEWVESLLYSELITMEGR